MTQDTHLEII